MKDEALRMALEALEWISNLETGRFIRQKATEPIAAIKQALAAPVQPVKPSLWEQYHAAQPAPVQEPESFEQWNAKQHGDPEEIGFLQALRIAYCSGQDSVMKATPPAQPAPVQPVAWGVFEGGNLHDMFFTREEADNMAHLKGLHAEIRPLTTPPAAQPAVPDAFGTREGEHPEYIQGWNDCRAEMLRHN
jgi:hypothetical protein